MGTTAYKRDALTEVIEAAKIHSQSLTDSLKEETRFGANPSFYSARRGYINRLEDALREVQTFKVDNESNSVQQRVRDLNLEEATALRFAVEDHIRNLVGRSSLA